MTSIDLNSDLGESYGAWQLGNDSAMLKVVSSANIACGFHAGDPLTISTTCREACRSNVQIGAHVSYNDLRGFGRRFIDVDSEVLYSDVIYQLGALDGLARASGSSISYVKPHGALYNSIINHTEQARAVAQAIYSYDKTLAVLGLAASQFFLIARDLGLRTVTEAFADRAYLPNGELVPRTHPQSVLNDPKVISQRALRLVTDGQLTAIDGSIINIEAQSICIHGDTDGAVSIATSIRHELEATGITIDSFIR
ncbi:MAG: LamB/YcsF family protein [Mycobacteriaceae bacterium]